MQSPVASNEKWAAVGRRYRHLLALDLFSGCGGLSLGLKRAGFRVLGGVEIDSVAADSYELNHPDVHLLRKDVLLVKARTWRKQLGLEEGELDLLAGCPPCQGYSSLRTRNGGKQNRDRRNSLVREMLRFARAFKPKAVMMENVPGLMGKAALLDLERGLRRLGYKVRCEVRDAQFYGVPQRRKRLILVAGRGFHIPLAVGRENSLTVRKALAGLKRVRASGDRLHDLPERRSARMKETIRAIPKNGGSRSALAEQRRCHQRCDGFKDTYGRMAWDEKAPTITGGCFNPSKGRFLHPRSNRCITMREAAMLQGFPRRYQFAPRAGKQALALMIGNALPPEFIRRHAARASKAIEQHLQRAGRYGQRCSRRKASL
jgi:DNA (cytosine-5)-methyltransferase 1